MMHDTIQNKRVKVNKTTFKKIISNNWKHKGNDVVYFSFKSTRGGSPGMRPMHWKDSYFNEITGLIDMGVETPAIKKAKKAHDKKMEREYKRRKAIENKYNETFAYQKTVIEENQVYQNVARVGIDIKNKIKKFSPIHGDISVDTYIELTQDEVNREVKKYNKLSRA
jgi:hypothetical protein